MARSATPTPIGPPRAALTGLRVLRGSRGVPETIRLRTTDAVAPWMEVVAVADEAIAAAERIVMAAAAGSRAAVINEANRLGHRATACRNEARRRVAGIESPKVPA